MGEVLVALAVGFGIMLMLSMACTAWVWRRVRARMEVSATVRTRPPIQWLVPVSTGARLHVRLRRSVAVLRAAVPRPRRLRRPGVLQELAAEIEASAVAIDRQLVAVGNGRPRPVRRTELTAAVVLVEQAVDRVVIAAARVAVNHDEGESLRAVHQRLDAIDAAWAEVERLEQAAGLRVPSA
jgi:hypothetical protein